VNQGQPIKVFSELRDMQIIDCSGELCGMVDDVEFEGGAGSALKIKSLLAGPGAYEGRLPRWIWALVRRFSGEQVHRIPWGAVEHVTSRVTLNLEGPSLGLDRVERRLRPALARIPFS